MFVLSQPRFHDEAAAFEYLESIVWADGKVCPHCGIVNGRMYDLAGVRGKPSKKSPEGALRHGLKSAASAVSSSQSRLARCSRMLSYRCT